MTAKKKRQTPKKTKAQISNSVKKQRQYAYVRVSRKIGDAMYDVMAGADKLLDCLPAFKRLPVVDRKRIYDYVDEITRNLCSYVDEYENALPEDMREEEAGGDDLRGLGALLGFAAALGSIGSRPPQSPSSDEPTEWPDSVDVEFRKIERGPKMLKW